MPYHVVGYTYTWWRGDALPGLSPLPDFRAGPAPDTQLLAQLQQLDVPKMEARIATGNHPYVAFLGALPAAYGWCATQRFGIQAVNVEWALRPGERGLWDFATLPAWRGQGIYPRLLQAILTAELPEAARFWISHRGDNDASRQGILKAGFQLVGMTALAADGRPKTILRGSRERALLNPMGENTELIEAEDADLVPADFPLPD